VRAGDRPEQRAYAAVGGLPKRELGVPVSRLPRSANVVAGAACRIDR
jgi:hypothetical protein